MKQFVSALFFLVLLVLPTQAQTLPTQTWAGTGVLTWSSAAGDINDDGNMDLIVTERPGSFKWLAGDGNGGFNQQQAWGGSRAYTGVALANFDKSVDGSLDAVFVGAYPNNFFCSTYTCEETEVYLNNGSGFPTTATWADGLNNGSWDVAVGDFNNDTWPDFAVANNDGSQVYLNNAATGAGFGFTQVQLPGGAINAQGVTVGRFNGDSLDDIAFSNGAILLNSTVSPGTFSRTDVTGGTYVDAGHFNNDAAIDLVFSSNYGSIRSYTNNGSGVFSLASTFGETGDPRFGAAVGDMNQDGFDDLAIAGYVAVNAPFEYLFLSDGDGTFTESYIVSGGSRAALFADYDADGDEDLFFGNLNIFNENKGPFEVWNTTDSGIGSLRQAILNANAVQGPDEITFSIPGASTTHIIQPLTELPAITDVLAIRASTQGDATCGDFGFNNRVLRVVLDGSQLPNSGDTGFDIAAATSTIEGFVIQNMPQHAIRVGADDGTILCNYIGTNDNGLTAAGANGRSWAGAGVFIEANQTVVSGNVVVGSSYDEIRVESGTLNLIQNNYVGVDRNVVLQPSPHTTPNPGNENRIGITSGNDGQVEGNVVGGFFEGVLANANAIVTNNRIGIGPNNESIPNTRGINLFDDGGTAGPDNILSNNGVGVLVQAGAVGNRITQNSMFSNSSDGIQLELGANNDIQPLNWTTAYINGAGELELSLQAPSAGTVELFKADSIPSGQGETFVSDLIDYTSAGSEQLFNLGDAGALSVGVGDVLVATLTDASNNTTPFSTTIQVAADPLVVINTDDSGVGSLRAAIEYANSTPNNGGPDEIIFNIPGAGPHTITLASALPNVTEAVTINGYSQPGSSANTASGFDPINADIRIQLDATGIASGYGINLTGHTGSEVRGLVIYGGPANALNLSGGGHKVKGSFIGNDGVNQFGTGGIHLGGGNDDEIGGPNPADRNIIMGGVGQEPSVNSPLIQGNYFGVKANGTEIFTTGRTTHSISSNQATFVEVRDNVMAGATWRDLSITHANGAEGPRNWTVINNRMGTDYTGTSILPAGDNGIYVQKGAHDNLFQENIIAGHAGSGILITQGDGDFSPLRNQIRRNSMFSNGEPGIALVPHSSGGTDSNDGITAPVIGDARISVDGHLVIPVSYGREGTIELFEADAQGQEGQRYFDFSPVTGTFAVIVITDLAGSGIVDGDEIVATLTDAAGNTSQFSSSVAVRTVPNPLSVTTTADSGEGSLRDAIEYANGNGNPAVPDTIWFNIPGPGPHVINLASSLPAITEPAWINGFTQSGSSPNTLDFDQGVNAVHQIILDGQLTAARGFDITTERTTIQGFKMRRFTERAIYIRGAGATDNVVAGNEIVDDPADNITWAVWVWGGATNNRIGGVSAGDNGARNVIGGHIQMLTIQGGGTDNNTVAYNYFGVGADGTTTTGGTRAINVDTFAQQNTVIGNLIAGVPGEAVNVSGSANSVLNNLIGTDASGTTVLGIGRGIQVFGNGTGNPSSGNAVNGNTIVGASGSGAIYTQAGAANGITISGNRVGLLADGTPAPNTIGIALNSSNGSSIQGNTVAYNTSAGIFVGGTSTGTIINNNSTFNNEGPGIQLAAGTNNDRTPPELYGTSIDASGDLVVVFEIEGPLTSYYVELFEADSDAEEGQRLFWAGNVSAQTGDLKSIILPDAAALGIAAGDRVVATLTQVDNSSQYTPVAAWVNPPDAYYVRTTANSGPNSLYSSIVAANMGDTHPSGTDRILFDIEGDYPATINVTGRPLPQINAPVVIDGGVDCSLNPEEYDFRIILQGDAGEINPVSENGLTLIDSASGSTIRGLVIHSFQLGGIVLDTTNDVTVSCNAIGVAEDMVTPMPNGQAAVLVTNGGANTSIDGNIFGTRSQLGYVVNNFLGSDLMFEDNWVGVSPKNGALLQNAQSIVGLRSENGGREIIRNNVFGGYSSYAVELIGSSNAKIEDNFIGVTPTGTAVPNGDGMVLHSNTNNALIQGNVIARNAAKGIRIEGTNSIDNKISQNSFYGNGSLAIDLGNDGFTANDANDADAGPNNLQNHPVLVEALRQSSNLGYVSVELNMDSAANIEFYLADADNQEGRTYLGTRPVDTPTAYLDLPFAGQINGGDWIVATATDANGNTSEFSGAIQVGDAPNAVTLADQLINDGTTSAPKQLAFSISAEIASIPGMTQALQAAFNSWSEVTTAEAGTKVSLNSGTVPETLPALQDNINLITQSSDAFPLSANTLAVASKLLAVGLDGQAQILGADIVFNRSLLANPSEGLGTDAQPGIWDVQAVATHELGHSMGLRHSGVSTATMFFSIPSGKSYRSLEVDDKAWISYRYPSTTFTSLGSISGNVADGEGATTGGMLGGALVIAKNVDSGARIHAYSDANGDFHIPGVPAGNYTLSIQPLDGFVDNIPGMVPGTVSPYLASITEYAQFSEENWSGVDEGGTETDDPAATLGVSPGEHVTAVNFVTNLDVTPPTVNGGSPSGLNASIRPDVAVTFSEPIIEPGLSITLTPAVGAPIAGIVQVPNAPGVVATFDLPNGTYLAYNTEYTISVSGATDKKGNTQSGTWTQTFTTRPEDQTAPALVKVTPGQGAIGVAPKTTLALAFSEPMNLESIRTGVTLCKVSATSCSTPLAGKWAFPSSSLSEALPQWTAIFTPDAMMDEGATYRIVVSGSVKDQAAGGGNALGAAQTFEFQTVPDLDPVLVDNGPTNGAGNVSVRTSVFADFSEPMTLPLDGSGNATGVTVTGALQGPVVGTVELLNEGRRVIFRPDSPLAFSDDFTAVFSNQITDATGHAISTLSIGFSTAAQPVDVTLETVSPLVSIPGSVVVFSGSGFNADPSLHTVLFPGPDGTTIPAEIDGSTLSTLSVIVPEGAKSGTVSVSTGGKTGTIDLEIYETIPLLDPAVARTTAESAPRDVEVTPDGGTAFVTNSGGGTVSVLNVGTGAIMATVGVGDSPLKVALTPDGRRAYVTNFGSNDISVIDTEIGSTTYLTEINRIDVGLNPFGLAISPDGKRLYVAEYTSRKISIIDIEEGSGSADRAIARIGVEINDRNVEGEPDGGVTRLGEESNPRDIEVSPDGGSLFFTTETLGLRVLLLDENGSADENAATVRITAESSTRDVEISPDGGLIFVTTLGGALEAYRVPPDLNSSSSFQAVARLGEESNSREVEVSPDGGLIYVTNFDLGLVQVYSITSLYTPSANSASGGFALTFEPVTAYSVGDNPEAVVFSAAAQVAIVANSGSGDVSVLRFDGETVVAADSDGDGLLDDEEILLGTDLNGTDSDGDGLTDGDEVNTIGTDPLVIDTDGDGLNDGDEVNTEGTNPLLADTDEDGLTDGDEVNTIGTDPLVVDTDGDGLTDGDEVNTLSTNPLAADTDTDGIEDGVEVSYANLALLDPNNADSDGLNENDGNADYDEDGKANKDDNAIFDGTQWFNVNNVHDGREESVEVLTTVFEMLTGEDFVVPDEDAENAANRIEKEERGGVKVNPYDDEFEGSRPVELAKGKSKKSDKSKKSTKSPEELAERLYDGLVGLAWNANPDKWISTVRPIRDYGNEIFNRDRNAVKAIEKVIDDIDDVMEEMGEEPVSEELNRLAEMLTDAAWDAASWTVENAVCDGNKGCEKKAKKARKELDDAQEEWEDGDLDKAIESMRKAWNQMDKYLPEDAAGKHTPVLAELDDLQEEMTIDVPVEFELGANYPNPFNPSTTIEFALPEAVNVNLTVFDMLGRRIQVLVDGPMDAGRHSVRFDASQLPSGMYLYRIQAGQKQQVRTMMLIK